MYAPSLLAHPLLITPLRSSKQRKQGTCSARLRQPTHTPPGGTKSSPPHQRRPSRLEYIPSSGQRSHAHLQADRSPGTPAELQETTIDYIHARHSPDDRVAPIRSMYKRDTVEGPLSQASGVEDTEGHQELVKKTIHKQETTEIYKQSTPSEDNVSGVYNASFSP